MSLKRARSSLSSAVMLAGGHTLPRPIIHLWRSSNYCDVQLRVSSLPGYHAAAHRLVLAAGSGRLARLLSDAPPLDSFVWCIDLPPMRSETLRAVLEFLYCGACEVDTSDTQLLADIASAATYLEIPSLYEAALLATRERQPLEDRVVAAETQEEGTAVDSAPSGISFEQHAVAQCAIDLSGPVITPISCPVVEELAEMTYHEFAVELTKVDYQLKPSFSKQKDRALKAFGVSEATLSEALKPKERQASNEQRLDTDEPLSFCWLCSGKQALTQQMRESVGKAPFSCADSYKIENMALDDWLQHRLEAMRKQGAKFTSLVEDDILNFVNANLATWNKDRMGQSPSIMASSLGAADDDERPMRPAHHQLHTSGGTASETIGVAALPEPLTDAQVGTLS
ncbi:MAG: hypothetical protein SGPRY_002526 [Prymnesium sp.]